MLRSSSSPERRKLERAHKQTSRHEDRHRRTEDDSPGRNDEQASTQRNAQVGGHPEARPNRPTVKLANPTGSRPPRRPRPAAPAGTLAEIFSGEPGLQGCQGDQVTAQVANPVNHPIE